jgi:hypothetical protein
VLDWVKFFAPARKMEVLNPLDDGTFKIELGDGMTSTGEPMFLEI